MREQSYTARFLLSRQIPDEIPQQKQRLRVQVLYPNPNPHLSHIDDGLRTFQYTTHYDY